MKAETLKRDGKYILFLIPEDEHDVAILKPMKESDFEVKPLAHQEHLYGKPINDGIAIHMKISSENIFKTED